MTPSQPPNEAAVRVFIDKMIAFRASLFTDEQRMLDALVDAGAHTRADIDVRPFWGGMESGTDLWAPYRAAATNTDPQSSRS
ncbi:MAG TPA: hypothetical protein VII06_30795 [Chloroflexota bacterium]|jgi:hypothetical protein